MYAEHLFKNYSSPTGNIRPSGNIARNRAYKVDIISQNSDSINARSSVEDVQISEEEFSQELKQRQSPLKLKLPETTGL